MRIISKIQYNHCVIMSVIQVFSDSNFNDGVTEARNFAISLLKELDFEVETIPTPIHPVILAKGGTQAGLGL